MNITILVIDQCPHAHVAYERVVAAIDRRPTLEIDVVTVNAADVAPSEFRGSPTILIDGKDPFPGGDRAGTLACRLYATETGTDGAPSVEQIRDALDGR